MFYKCWISLPFSTGPVTRRQFALLLVTVMPRAKRGFALRVIRPITHMRISETDESRLSALTRLDFELFILMYGTHGVITLHRPIPTVSSPNRLCRCLDHFNLN